MSPKDNLEETSLYVCPFEGCNKRFKKPSKLLYHKRKHTGERPFQCDEENCGKSYTNPAHLRRHKTVSHEKKKKTENLVCTIDGCLKVFANKYSLKKHCSMKHNPDRKFPFHCEKCSQGFTKKRLLLKHSYEHTGVAPFKCDKCEARYLTLVDCNRHKRTHTVYTCECGEKFERWSLLLGHRKNCMEAKPKCTVCSKTCSGSVSLRLHEQIHKDEAEREVFPCIYENCMRFYFHKKNLHFHIDEFHKKKSNEPKIPCTFENCKQMFRKKQYLKNHLKIVHAKKKVIKPRKERKDKNIPRKSLAGMLSALDVPLNAPEKIIDDIFKEVECQQNET